MKPNLRTFGLGMSESYDTVHIVAYHPSTSAQPAGDCKSLCNRLTDLEPCEAPDSLDELCELCVENTWLVDGLEELSIADLHSLAANNPASQASE